jgi:hypothetical protein
VIIVLDNCGLELVSDLLLVDGLLRSDAPPLRVRLWTLTLTPTPNPTP